ncbi:hypothetical protein CHS0354_006451 [Potamilus streckersoni]|uniref:Uncharacterized protein n=1 Tax=Potamilus streckersoni TaxID=2493646 RepID=A0AAE0T963_9BIVA|nr:hypothetical protein CHS0354_006451 [Potamilus streckersoni]
MRSAVSIVYFVFSACILCLKIKGEESREHTIAKRVPGWGKRDMSSDYENVNSLVDSDKLNSFEDESQAVLSGVMKRKPGWGKRNLDSEFSEMDKRKPGWGKRSEFDLMKRKPGWGKRDSGTLYGEDGLEDEMEKRRPGWGKRSEQDYILDKRRPGWGKRVPGWGKRSNDFNPCQRLDERIGLLKLQLAQGLCVHTIASENK